MTASGTRGACASTPKSGRATIALQGAQRQELARDVGDFVVRRSDGLFAYQLAVVVDDGEQQITDVVRGADLLSSTPRQILLQDLLRLPTPAYLHVPVAINQSGEKLSKQTRAVALPDTPLPVLLEAWRFLGQSPFAQPPTDVAEFWKHAKASWRATRLPPVPMLPAPAAMDGGAAQPRCAKGALKRRRGAACRARIIAGSARRPQAI